MKTELKTGYPFKVEIDQANGRKILEILRTSEADPNHQLICSIDISRATTVDAIRGIIFIGLTQVNLGNEGLNIVKFADSLANLIMVLESQM